MPTDPKGQWNYHPDLPLQDPSIFRWPPNAGFLARWFWKNWLSLSERVMLLLIAIAAWTWLYPSLEASKTLAIGWIAQTYLINLALMFRQRGTLEVAVQIRGFNIERRIISPLVRVADFWREF